MISTVEEVILRGLPVSKGIGIGLPVFFSNGMKMYLKFRFR